MQMLKKTMAIILIAMTAVFAQSSEKKEEIIPFVFNWNAPKVEAANPYAHSTTNFHLSMLSGRVKSVQGIQIGLIQNYVKDDFIGYNGTLFYSQVGGNYSGFQSVGFVSQVKGDFVGINESGIYSSVTGNFTGVQTGGLVSDVKGSFKGAQFSSVLNRTTDITGAQIGGIVNIAENVKGIQIGLVNRSKKLDGIAIGLVNLSEEGNVYGIGWAGGSCDYSAGIKFAPNDYWYTIISIGDIQDSDEMGNMHVLESRMGLHYQLFGPIYIEGDLGSGTALPYNIDDWEDSDNIWGIFDARAALGVKIGKRFSVFGGLSTSYKGHGKKWADDFTETKPFIGIQF